MSHAVVGLLDRTTEARVRELRHGLEGLVGVAGLDALPLPHLSLVVCEVIDAAVVAEAVEQVAPTLVRTPVRAEPWGVFAHTSAPTSCALVRCVTRTPDLDALRAGVSTKVEPGMRSISAFTTTASWNPHITLASQGLAPRLLGPAVDHLVATDEPPWEAQVERLALVVEEGPRHRLVMSAELPG